MPTDRDLDPFDLGDLRRALDAATPPPDPLARAAHLRLARETFARLHGTPRRPGAWPGARGVLNALATPGALAAATALVAFGILALSPAGPDLWRQRPSGGGEVAAAVEPGAEAAGPAPPAAAKSAEAGAPSPAQPRAAPSPAPEAADMATEAAVAGEAPVIEGEPPPSAVAPYGDVLAAPPPADVPADVEALADAGEGSLAIATGEPIPDPTGEDAASYWTVRRSLASGVLPPPEAVRVGEMVNAFAPGTPAPAAGEGPFRSAVTVLPTPWNPRTRLVTVVIRGEAPAGGTAQGIEARVEWNPDRVAARRPVGLEAPAPGRRDGDRDRLDAGGLRAGRSVAAIYEVTPVEGPARPAGSSRSAGEAAGAAPLAAPAADLGVLWLTWTEPGGAGPRVLETPILEAAPAPEVLAEARFAAAVAGWGLLLRGSAALDGWGYEEAIALAGANLGPDPSGARAEAVRFMRLSQRLAE